jgi:outer membrane protein OmpA-like peptidoglycan-associated protein
MKRLTLLLALLTLGLLPCSAVAQMIPKTVEIDGFGGYYGFMSRGGFGQDDTVKLENIRDSAHGGFRVGINFTKWAAFEGTFSALSGRSYDTLRRVDYVNAHFDGVFHLPFPFVIPYGAIGFGFQHYNVRDVYAAGIGPADFDAYHRDPHPTSERLDPSKYITYRAADGDFLIDAGGGVKFLVFERTNQPVGFGLGFRLDGRYKLSLGPANELDGVPTLEVGPDPDPNTGHAVALGWRGVFHHVDLNAGVFILIGGGTGLDRDKDGIANQVDECQDEPEDIDDFQDEDGCPDNDNDRDGVPDEVDRCRDDAEDKDGFEDRDGCPDLDNDGDGVTDADDECPDRKEDEDGYEDRDGCPELDNDQDGWMDPDDACPNAAENFNSYLDGDGCPDKIPGDLAEFAGAIPAIQFEVGSSRLKRSSFDVLNRAANTLMRYPDLNVEIGGHASSDGDDEANMMLSQERVMTVRDYLIDRGVNPDMLRAVGYGETKPVASNDTEEGRRQNRRVEFTLSQ